MYVLGPELINQPAFTSGFTPGWWDNGAVYFNDGQATFYGSIEGSINQLLYGTSGGGYTMDIERNAQYLLTFDVFGEGLIYTYLGQEDYQTHRIRGQTPARRVSFIMTATWEDPDNPQPYLGLGAYYSLNCTVNNFSLKKILSTDPTSDPGGGHAEFRGTFAQTENLIYNGAFNNFTGDPFGDGGWVNSGSWVWDSTRNGRLTHTGSNVGVATTTMDFANSSYLGNLVPQGSGSYAGTYLVYMEIGGTSGSVTVGLGSGTGSTSQVFSTGTNEQISYPPNSGWSSGRGVIMTLEKTDEGQQVSLTPSSDFEGWVDNLIIRQIGVPFD